VTTQRHNKDKKLHQTPGNKNKNRA